MAVNYKPLESQYGYKSPGFVVDDTGNVTVRTVTSTYIPTPAESVNFIVSEDASQFTMVAPSAASYTPTAASYTPSTGVMVLTIGTHTLQAGNKIKIAPNSLTFTCNMDGHATEKTYPRATGSAAPGGVDYFYDKEITLTGRTETTITMNVGDTSISGNNHPHTFVRATADCVTNESLGTNPLLSLERGQSYVFKLNELSSLTFNTFSPDGNNPLVPGNLFNDGLKHVTTITGNTLVSGTLTFTQSWQQETDYNRSVSIVVPDTANTPLQGKQIPVVISLHNTNKTMGNGIANITYMTDKILIAPQGYNNEWNVGYQTSKANDIAFLDSIIEELEKYDNVDTTAITIVGKGNGGQLAHQYGLQTTKTNVTNIVIESALFHEDQYRKDTNTFYGMNLTNLGDSTVVSWSAVSVLPKNILMFHGEVDLVFPYNGGTVSGQTFTNAEDTIYGWAKANNTAEAQLSNSGVTQSDGSNLFSYNSGDVQMYGFPNIAQNWDAFLTSVQAKINALATPSSYLNIPVITDTTEGDAQGKATGLTTWEVPVDAPDVLFYGNSNRNPYGSVAITNPTLVGIGSFSSILNTGNFFSSGEDAIITMSPTGTGTVTISPAGGGFINNVNVNATNLTVGGEVTITPNEDVTISPQANGTLAMNPLSRGEMNNMNIGGSIAGDGSFSSLVSSGGTLNNTTIGVTTPANAGFLTATAENVPTDKKDLGNKAYIDNTSMVYSIALGV